MSKTDIFFPSKKSVWLKKEEKMAKTDIFLFVKYQYLFYYLFFVVKNPFDRIFIVLVLILALIALKPKKRNQRQKSLSW